MESYVRTPLHDDLTPVRIRGKRYAPGQKTTIQTKRNNTNNSTSYTPDRSKNGSHLSRLETLPTELLHLIFRLCPNIYLPLASSTLGQILSDNAIKTHIVIQTLSNRQTSIEAVAEASGHTSIASLQSEVLNRKWLTLDFLRDALEEAVKLDGPSDDETEDDSDEDSNASASETESDRLSVTSSDSRLGRLMKWDDPSNLYSLLELNQCTAVPVKLLHGPWADSKITLLRLLFRAGASIERVTSTDDEVASASLLEALKASHTKVALALLPWPYRKSQHDGVNSTEATNLGVIPDTNHFRAAIFQGGCDRAIVLTMLVLPNTEIDVEDRAVWKWIHDSISGGDARGSWLKQTLEETSKLAKDPVARTCFILDQFPGQE